MSNDIELELRGLQQRIAQAQNAQTRAEVERDNAKAQIAETKKALKEQFGVETVEDAKALLKAKEEELQAELAKAEDLLVEAGA